MRSPSGRGYMNLKDEITYFHFTRIVADAVRNGFVLGAVFVEDDDRECQEFLHYMETKLFGIKAMTEPYVVNITNNKKDIEEDLGVTKFPCFAHLEKSLHLDQGLDSTYEAFKSYLEVFEHYYED